MKEWHEEHIEDDNKQRRALHEKNAEKDVKQRKKWHKENKKKENKKQREWYNKDPDKKNAKKRKFKPNEQWSNFRTTVGEIPMDTSCYASDACCERQVQYNKRKNTAIQKRYADDGAYHREATKKSNVNHEHNAAQQNKRKIE